MAGGILYLRAATLRDLSRRDHFVPGLSRCDISSWTRRSPRGGGGGGRAGGRAGLEGAGAHDGNRVAFEVSARVGAPSARFIAIRGGRAWRGTAAARIVTVA
jgi:hypothetical protein